MSMEMEKSLAAMIKNQKLNRLLIDAISGQKTDPQQKLKEQIDWAVNGRQKFLAEWNDFYLSESTQSKTNGIKAFKKKQIQTPKPRIKARHKNRDDVFMYWSDWGKNRALYPNKADFIRDMQEKTGIKSPRIIMKYTKKENL